jgi:hypothetical protein
MGSPIKTMISTLRHRYREGFMRAVSSHLGLIIVKLDPDS